jgi:hypothetical protein
MWQLRQNPYNMGIGDDRRGQHHASRQAFNYMVKT